MIMTRYHINIIFRDFRKFYKNRKKLISERKDLVRACGTDLPLELGVVVAHEGPVISVAQAGQGLDHGGAALLGVDHATRAAHVSSDPT